MSRSTEDDKYEYSEHNTNSTFSFSLSDYTLEFPRQGLTDYANIWGMRSLTQFTVCFWVKTSLSKGTPFSYASSCRDNDLLIDIPGNFLLSIGNKIR